MLHIKDIVDMIIIHMQYVPIVRYSKNPELTVTVLQTEIMKVFHGKYKTRMLLSKKPYDGHSIANNNVLQISAERY